MHTDQSNFELTSKEKVDSIGVMASSAVCSKKIQYLEKWKVYTSMLLKQIY